MVYEFIVDDVSYSRKEEIYKMLAEINQQLKIVGYVAEVVLELYNFDLVEEKGYVLIYYSEKLVIVFGIFMILLGIIIRVIKNFRICVDCYNFVKFVFCVYDCVVIVRDCLCFYYFKGGFCFCNDFW